MVSGEEDAEKPVVIFGSLVVRIGCAAFTSHADGACGSVVSVSDIGDRDVCEGLDECGGVIDFPDAMRDAVWRGKICAGGCGESGVDEGVDGWGLAVGEENRAGICVEGADESGAVVFFVFPSFFVFFDDVVFVVLNVANGGDAGLNVVTHLLLVEVEDGS